MTSVFTLTSKVLPSGGERTTSTVPMLPDAPGLLSTNTVRFRRERRPGAIWRAIRSMPVPGVKGTTNLICKSSSAWTNGAASAAMPPSMIWRRRAKRAGSATGWVIFLSPSWFTQNIEPSRNRIKRNIVTNSSRKLMNLSARQLQAFLEVSRLQSFARAAEQVHLSPPE